MPRKRQGRRDFGSIKTDGTPSDPRFSAVWWEGGRKRRRRGFDTRTKAEEFLARVRVELDDGTRQIGDSIVTEGVTLSHAIEAYGKHQGWTEHPSGCGGSARSSPTRSCCCPT